VVWIIPLPDWNRGQVLGGVRGIGVKLSDLVGWHGQTLFVRTFLATHNGTKSTGIVAGNCPPLAGDQGGGKGTRKQYGKNQKPMKPIITFALVQTCSLNQNI